MKLSNEIIQFINCLGSKSLDNGPWIIVPNFPGSSRRLLVDRLDPETLVGTETTIDLAPSGNTVIQRDFKRNTELADKIINLFQ